MVRLDKIYTRGGDQGETGLGDGSRVSKAGLRVAAIGAVDEANAAIGIARVAAKSLDAEGGMDAMLGRIQNDLFDLGADLCVPEDGRKAQDALRITPAQVERLEREIDAMNERLSPLTSFVLPGGTAPAAHLHMARTITRRAETHMVALAQEEAINPAALRYINRLSDHLFVVARAANADGDVLWVPGGSRNR
ncbi:MAG: ATP:cob(I)alamin adenosyltransferase [Alphaproteobacteria bacterium 64-11]|nr:cob(I)yrinic acid a,c-diamide adenosyltransferase [Alphaproteobacteria bacterium]OJU12683.1 MAG: ATP:cob(I)alamin adenosyltransferase [Alphaproteobacteria bacterium 64-11]